jgi:hypothetical protein
MNHHQPTPPDVQTAALQAGTQVSRSRRQLLRAGAASAPVLLTLASNPVAATGTGAGACTVASSFVSVATFNSRNANAGKPCMTTKCEDIRSNCANNATIKKNYQSVTVKGVLGDCSPKSSLSDATIYSVFIDCNGIETKTERGVLQHLLTLWINLDQGTLTGLANGLNKTYISDVWKAYKAGGDRYVKSTGKINWDSEQLVVWCRRLIYG